MNYWAIETFSKVLNVCVSVRLSNVAEFSKLTV